MTVFNSIVGRRSEIWEIRELIVEEVPERVCTGHRADEKAGRTPMDLIEKSLGRFDTGSVVEV